MDFFEYANIAREFTNTLWVWLLVGLLCFAIVFVFEAIALYTIATREGYKNKWMAFVPFLNTYYIGVCAQKNRFYNMDTKKLAVAAAVFEFILCAGNILFLVCESVMLNSNAPYNISDGVIYYPMAGVPSNLKWAAWIYNYMDIYILLPLSLIYSLLLISLLISFFQTYACRRYVLFTITSILFPIMGILFFVVRNNKGINYKEFLRAEQARQYRQYQQYYQQNYNQNPYNRNPYDTNPYNQPPQNNGGHSAGTTDDPFADFGSGSSDNSNRNAGSPFGDSPSGDSPFDDFDKN